jgi:hypothetical protein
MMLAIHSGVMLATDSGAAEKVANFPPEQVANFSPEWVANFPPESMANFPRNTHAKLEKVMESMIGSGYVASFIGHEPGKALFIGLYSIGKAKPLMLKQYYQVPAYVEMKKFGMQDLSGDDKRQTILWFNLELTKLYVSWKGKLVVGWPPPERSWWRRAHRNNIPILSILEESVLDAAMPDWEAINLSWEEIGLLPIRWRSALSQWRGIYYIFDTSDGKGYVGAAYGEANIYGRWLNYAKRGHGGNKLLKQRDPRHLRFSILQRVSPDMNASDLIRLESSWKERLHTRQPFGLNDN